MVSPLSSDSLLADIFHGEAGLAPALQRPLPKPWLINGDLLYVSARGVEELLVEAGYPAAVVGRGAWLLPETIPSAAGSMEKTLNRILPESALLPRGFRLQSTAFIELLQEEGPYRYLRVADGIAVLQQYTGRRLALLLPLTLDTSNGSEAERRVKAGASLEVLISSGGLVIKAQGIANRSGLVGDRIPVTLKTTRRRVEALIIDLGLAEVRL